MFPQFPFIDEGAEAQRDLITCPRILSWKVAELGLQGLCAQTCPLPAVSPFGDVEGIAHSAALCHFAFRGKNFFSLNIGISCACLVLLTYFKLMNTMISDDR